MKIKTVKISNFRGIPNLVLELGGKSLLVGGENGTGKSSIVDSLEYFFLGKIEHLKGTKGITFNKHAPNVYSNLDDLKIELVFNPGSINLRRSNADIPEPPKQFKKAFETAEEGNFILRRNQLLNFIFCKPKERHNALLSLFRGEKVYSYEEEFDLAYKHFKDKLRTKKITKSKNFKKLAKILKSPIDSVDDCYSILNEKILDSNLNIPLIKQPKDFDISLKHLKEIGAEEIIEVSQNLLKIKLLSDKSFFQEHELENFNHLREELASLKEKEYIKEIQIMKLLQASIPLFETFVDDKCPLCEQIIDRIILQERIDERLIDLVELSKQDKSIRRKLNKFVNSFKEKSKSLNKLKKKLEDFDIFLPEKTKFEITVDEISNISKEFGEIEFSLDELELEVLDRTILNLNSIKLEIENRLNNELKEISLSENYQKIYDISNMILKVQNQISIIKEDEEEIKSLSKRGETANNLLNIFSDIKNRNVQEIYNRIQSDIDDYYKTLHPNEVHKGIKLQIEKIQKGSTSIKIKSFNENDEDPRAYLSEGHLDSLGLCIFLAFIKNFNKDCSLILLDDVVTTIDSKHRENICKILFEDFKDKQMIITTHDQIWYEQIRANQRKYGLEGSFVNLDIIGWNEKSGPIIRPFKPNLEKIETLLKDNEKSLVASETRRYLEWLLEEMCITTKSAVPIKRIKRYTVSELMNPLIKRVKNIISDENTKENIESKFKDLESTILMGNLLTHNNLFAENYSIHEIRKFYEAVKNLHLCFQCESCGSLLGYSSEFKFLRCLNTKCIKPTEIKAK